MNRREKLVRFWWRLRYCCWILVCQLRDVRLSEVWELSAEAHFQEWNDYFVEDWDRLRTPKESADESWLVNALMMGVRKRRDR